MLGALLAASLSVSAAAQASKLDARLRARRSASAALGGGGGGGYSPLGAGGGAPAAGPLRNVLIRVSPGTPLAALRAAFPSAELDSQAGDVVAARLSDAAIDALALDGRVQAIEHAVYAHPSMNVVRSSSSASGLALGAIYGAAASDLTNATGAGVVVGIVDTGIDYTHKDFINDGPNTSRILSIWDQTISSHASGPFPAGFTYGAEYTNAQLTSKIQGGVVVINTTDDVGHGTHVAGIAASDGTETGGYMGMAPSADIVMVRTDFSLTGIVNGMNYIVAKAAAAGKRAVINLSLGSQYGPHDGTSTFETGVAAVAASTPVVVAMGNEGGDKPHASATVGSGGSTVFTIGVDYQTAFADVELWHPGGDAYTATVSLAGIGGSTFAVAGSSTGGLLGGHTIRIYNGVNPAHPLGHKQIYVEIERLTGVGITAAAVSVSIARTSNGGTGRVDGWVDISSTSYSSNVDNTMTLGEPACAQNVFGAASYVSRKFWDSIDGLGPYAFGNTATPGNLSVFSSQGPTRDGRQQPDVAAPGEMLISALSTDPVAYPGAPYVTPDGKHRVNRGTSMASPVVAGILAARLQWNPGITVAGLRSLLRTAAKTDGATGSVPNGAWGYGKVNASPQPVVPPTGLSGTALGVSSITWTWSAVTGADAYSLYYATNPASRLASVSALTYTQTALQTNTTTGVIVKGSGAGVDGPSGFASTSTYPAPPAALPTVTPHIDSVTVSWTVCPPSPAAVSCWGYAVEASTAANLTGTVFSATTLNRANSSLQVTGLQALTTYYFRQSTLNFYAAPAATGAVKSTTLTDLVAPINPSLSGATTSTIRFDWNTAGNAPGLTYLAEASTAASFSGTVLSSATKNAFAILSGLATNTSYYFRVQAVGGPYLIVGAPPTPTIATNPGLSTAPYSGVTQTGFTVAWSSGGNAGDTLYQADISVSASFVPVLASSITRNVFATFGGLTPNTLYYTRALAISHGGIASAYTTFGSTPTFVLDPTLPAAPFSNVGPDGFTFSFNGGGNPAGTVYVVRISTDPGFGALAGSVNITSTFTAFSGLNSNRLYYAAVAALNLSGSPTAFTAAVSTGTTVVAPGAPGAAVSARTTSSLSTSWSASTLGPGTQYVVQASSFANFSLIAGSSTTLNVTATVSALPANTLHYLRVRALSLNPPTPDGSWTAIGSGSTLANAPGAAGSPFTTIGVASVTVAWTALPLAPQPAACEGYLAELSVTPGFSPILRSVTATTAQSTATFTGLAYGTLYYMRVAALDWEGNPNYLVIGSTRTGTPMLSSGTVTGSGLTLTLPPSFLVAPAVNVTIPAGAFAPGTVVTMLAGVTQDLTNPPSAVAKLTALGSSVGIDISAGGIQPLKPVRLAMSYDPLLLPLGADPRKLLIARYDEASALWTLVPSAADTSANQIVATLDHFSSYSPFFAAAGGSVSDGVVFPQPWEVGEPNGAYGSQALTFANFPDGTKIRVLSLTGEQVWEGTAAANGVLTWDGRNSHGRNCASGTYYAIIEGGGARKVRRVVLIR